MKTFLSLSSLAAIAAIAAGAAAMPEGVPEVPSMWNSSMYRNAYGYKLCAGWLDAKPEERAKMPRWCEDWATGDE